MRAAILAGVLALLLSSCAPVHSYSICRIIQGTQAHCLDKNK